MTRTLVTFSLVLALLALASAAMATPQTVSGSIEIKGSGTKWTVTVKNAASSTGNIECWRMTLQFGVQATEFGAVPAGWQMGTSKPFPSPIIGGRSETGIPPGGSASFEITTDKPLDPNEGPGSGAISENCATDVPAAVTIVVNTPPKPPPTACNCTNLGVVGTKYSSSQVNTGDAQLKLSLNWTMKCSGAAGRPCSGRIALSAPKGSDIKIVSPKGDIRCNGRCRLGPSTHKGTTVMRATSAGDLYFDNRAGKSFVFKLKLYCTRGGKEVLVGAKRMTFAFGSGGFLDKKKSDLNGNGVPDGKEKK